MDYLNEFWANPQNQLMTLMLVSFVAQALGRAIPDDKTGIPGAIRKLAKVLGLYVDSRIHSGVSANSVAQQVINGEIVGDGRVTRGPDGKFAKREQ